MHMRACTHTDWVKLNPHVKCIGHPFTQEWESCLLCVRMYVYVHVMPTGLLQSSQGFLSATTEEEREGDWDRVEVPTFLSHLCNILFPSPSPLKPVSPLTQDQFTTVIMQLTPIKSFHCKNVCVHMYMCACVHVCALSMLMCAYTHDRAITAAQGSLLETESTAINQSAFRWLWHEKRAWPLLTLGVSPNLLYLPTQEWLSVCVKKETQRGWEGEWWIGMEISKLMSGSQLKEGGKRKQGRAHRVEKPWGCWAGEL